MDDTRTENRIGTCLAGQYEVIERLGAGRMGAVYKARNKALGTTVALKIVREKDPTIIARMVQEAKVLGALSHPNIVKVYSLVLDETGEYFLVAEFLDGQDLGTLIAREGPLSAERATRLIVAAADGLTHAHSRGVIHRDLKPGNIMVIKGADGQETVKVVDFGIAKIAAGVGQISQKLTSTGAMIGTPYYMSPEQCSGATVEAPSDIYSLGCVLYECLTGKIAFEGESSFEIMYKHLNQEAPPLTVPGSGFLTSVVAKAMCANRDSRFQTMEEFAQALREQRTQLLTGTTKKRPKIAPAGRFRVLALITVCIAVITGIAVCMYTAPHPPQQDLPPRSFDAIQKDVLTAIAQRRFLSEALLQEMDRYLAESNHSEPEEFKNVADLYGRADLELKTTLYLAREKQALYEAIEKYHARPGQPSPARDQIVRLLTIYTALDDPEMLEKTVQLELKVANTAAARRQFEPWYREGVDKDKDEKDRSLYRANCAYMLARLYQIDGKEKLYKEAMAQYQNLMKEPSAQFTLNQWRTRLRYPVNSESASPHSRIVDR